MRNLVGNAIAHTAEGTTVETVIDSLGVVRVCDRGPGVALEDRQLIFRRFWRRDRRRTNGAGLGLAIVSRIVEAHGGVIAVSDNVGGGAVFSVSLVAARLAAEACPIAGCSSCPQVANCTDRRESDGGGRLIHAGAHRGS